MSITAIKYRAISFAVKYASSVALPIAIAKTYGTTVNGDVQLLIAATGYLGLLDSGMTISALNRGGIQSDDPKGNINNILILQSKSSLKIFVLGICISVVLLFAASWNRLISASLLFGGSFLAMAAILEIATTPFKYHLYSYGLAGTVEKREAFLSMLSTLILFVWSMLILAGQLPLLVGLPIGLILLRADRVVSGLASLLQLKSLAKITTNNSRFTNKREDLFPIRSDSNDDRFKRVWISALQVLAILNWSVDIFLIKFIVGAAAVSDYSIYSKLFLFPIAIVTLAYPVIQSSVSQGRLNSARFALFVKAFWPCILGSTTLAVLCCHNILSAFPSLPSKLGLSTNPSIYLIISFCYLSVLSTVSGFYAPIANGLQLFKWQVIISTIFLPSNLILSWFLGSRCGLGMVGVIAATCLTMTVTSSILLPREIIKCLNKMRNQEVHIGII